MALPSSSPVILLQYREEGFTGPLLGRECEDRGVTASERGAGARKPFVTRRRVVLVQVDVGVDTAGCHIGTLSVNYSGIKSGGK